MLEKRKVPKHDAKKINHIPSLALLGIITDFEQDEDRPVRFTTACKAVISREGNVVIEGKDEPVPIDVLHLTSLCFDTAQQLTSWLEKFGAFKDSPARLTNVYGAAQARYFSAE